MKAMATHDFITQNALNYTNMSDLIFYSITILGGISFLYGVLYDLAKGPRRFRNAEMEANRHSHTVKDR